MSTRFYFPVSTAADVSPAFDSGWNYTSEAVRRRLEDVKGTSDITVGTQIGPWTAGNYALDRQYVSDPLAAQSISGTVKMQLMTREYDDTDNVGALLTCIKVVSNDGSTVRGTLLSLGNYGPASEFINDPSHRNKTGADGDSLTAVSAQSGDRLVVEIGYTDGSLGITPEASAKWGERATDLPENETQTTDGTGWIEFSADIQMRDQDITGAGNIASAEAFGTAVMNPGQVDIEPAGIASGETFGTPKLGPPTRYIQPSGVASGEAFGTATVAEPGVTLQPSGIASAEAFGTGEVKAVIYPEDTGSTTRTTEVVRVGSVSLKKEYPDKRVVRLRDLSMLYEGGELSGLSEVADAVARYQRKRDLDTADNLAAGVAYLSKGIDDLYSRMRGTRLSKVNVEVWDQISGAYLGAYGTDRHGTLILPTDKQFVEVLQWKIAGGGYSDAFNGERGAGTPSLYFYFPCNEGEGTVISGFPGVSGQQVDFSDMTTPWEWYESGFFNRPALKVKGTSPENLTITGAPPLGYRSFQFLWYCSDKDEDRLVFAYSVAPGVGGVPSGADFWLEVEDGKLKATVAKGTDDAEPQSGTTNLSSGKWYLVHINTRMYGGYPMEIVLETGFQLEMDVYLGETTEPEISVETFAETAESTNVKNSPLIVFLGSVHDGFDELRHLDRELYVSEVQEYGKFLKQTRVYGKSMGELGDLGW